MFKRFLICPFVDKVDEDRQALLNLERNIAIIERSMSASQLQSVRHQGKRQVMASLLLALDPPFFA